MSLSGPVLVVADEANDVCEALTRGGNLPMREVAPANAVGAVAKAKPSAVVLANCPEEIACLLATKLAKFDGPIVPLLAVVPENAPAFANALPIPAESVSTRLVPRLRSALPSSCASSPRGPQKPRNNSSFRISNRPTPSRRARAPWWSWSCR